MSGQEPALPTDEQRPNGTEPGIPAEYALLDVIYAMSDIDPTEREAAIELLLELGTEAIPAIIRASTETRRDSRLAAASLMGRLNDDAFIPELERLVCDRDEWVVTVAADSLITLLRQRGQLAAGVTRLMHTRSLTPYALRQLATHLRHEDTLRWLFAERQLAMVPLQVWVGLASSHRAAVEQAITGHGAAGLTTTLEQLRHILRWEAGTLAYVGHLLGGFANRDPATVPPIIDFLWEQVHTLPHPAWLVRYSLESITDPAPIITLLNRFYEAEEWNHPAASNLFALLVNHATPACRDCLKRWATVPHSDVRQYAQFALERMA